MSHHHTHMSHHQCLFIYCLPYLHGLLTYCPPYLHGLLTPRHGVLLLNILNILNIQNILNILNIPNTVLNHRIHPLQTMYEEAGYFLKLHYITRDSTCHTTTIPHNSYNISVTSKALERGMRASDYVMAIGQRDSVSIWALETGEVDAF